MDALTYLQRQCRLHRNVLTGEVLYAPARGEDYRLLSQPAINTLILQAESAGVNLSEEQLKRYVASTLIETRNPAETWLDALDEWDGTDYVTQLSDRIITSNPEWTPLFHRWLLQMVARWTGYPVAHDDLLIPLLVGPFGYGKTSFCNHLLPPVLRRYYTDRIRLRSRSEVHDLVSTHLLLCIDEFYQEHTDQEPIVQYLFSRSTPVFRAPYGTTEEPRGNYAAFIATTGNLHPMTDAAGAARLLCVEVERPIDFSTPVPYEQLYAQLQAELEEGAELTLSQTDREHMAVQNAPYQEADNLVKMIQALYGKPHAGKKVKATFIDAIVDRLMREYPYWTPGEHVNQDIGFALQEAGFKRSRIHGRSAYRVMEKDPRKLDFVAEEPDNETENFDDNPLARALLSGLGNLAGKTNSDAP